MKLYLFISSFALAAPTIRSKRSILNWMFDIAETEADVCPFVKNDFDLVDFNKNGIIEMEEWKTWFKASETSAELPGKVGWNLLADTDLIKFDTFAKLGMKLIKLVNFWKSNGDIMAEIQLK